MTIEEAIKIVRGQSVGYPVSWSEQIVASECVADYAEKYLKQKEAWDKVREDLRKFIDANSNSGDMYLDGRADGGWHALATIKRCLGEIEKVGDTDGTLQMQ